MSKICDKCQIGEIENNRCWWCGEENINSEETLLDSSPVCFGFLPTDETFSQTIMAMGQVFDDQRRRWEGYWIYFYPHEFAPPNPKSLSLLHIHFKGQNGELRVYLPSVSTEIKWGNVPKHEQNKIIKFVERNKQDIMNKIENELRARKI